MKEACRKDIAEKSERSVAGKFDISRQTLARLMKKCKNSQIIKDFKPNCSVNIVFSKEEGELLSECAKLNFGLTMISDRILAVSLQ